MIESDMDNEKNLAGCIAWYMVSVERRSSSVIVVVSFQKGQELMMEELAGMTGCLSCLADEAITWGIQEVEETMNSRSASVFAFE